jgi:thioesterase domain-containing protein
MVKFRVQEQLGVNLPLTALFETPTVEGLATRLRHGEGNGRESVLVPLRPTGSPPAWFLVHPTAGSVFCYRELVGCLAAEQPVYGLQSVGLDGEEEPLTAVADMAAHYVRQMRQVQKAGPYVLGGWSMGGLVALEMAQQLRSEGDDVRLVVIDAPLLEHAPGDPPLDESARTSFLREFTNQLGRQVDMGQFALEALSSAEQLGEWLRAAGLTELQHHLRVAETNLTAHVHYRPQPYFGDVVLICPEESLAGVLADTLAQWQGLVGGQLRVGRVPGNHYTMLQPPHVAVLAQRLVELLSETSTAQS